MKGFFAHLMVVVVLLMSVGALAIPVSAENRSVYKCDFEKTVQPWIPAANKLPVNEHTFVLKQEPVGDFGVNGYGALSSSDADALWVVTPFTVSADKVAVKVQFQMKNMGTPRATDVLQPMIYIGASKPGIQDFKLLGKQIGTQWWAYSASNVVKTPGGHLFVAIGYVTGQKSWIGIDNVLVSVSYSVPLATEK